MITIQVSKEFNDKNKDLIDIFNKKDIQINEAILSYGYIIYQNQKDFIINYNDDNFKQQKTDILNKYEEYKTQLKDKYSQDIQNIKDLYHNKEIQLKNLIQDLEKDKENYIQQLKQNYTQKEIQFKQHITQLQNEKTQIQNDIQNTFNQKELQLNTQIQKLTDEKIQLNTQYYKQLNDTQESIKKQYESQINEYKKQIHKLNNERIVEIDALIQQGKNITKQEYELLIQEKNNQIQNNLKHSQQTIHILEQQIKDLQSHIQNNQNKDYDIYHNLKHDIQQLKENQNQFQDKILHTNTYKGIIAEEYFSSYIYNTFSGAELIDTSAQYAKGDYYLHFDKAQILVEVKNVQYVKQDDFNKFDRDIQIAINNQEINSALFISSNDTNLINNKRNYVLEFKYNIPIIYISNTFKYPEFIRFVIFQLNYLIKYGFTNNNNDNDEKQQFIIYNINMIFEQFQKQYIILNDDKKYIKHLENNTIKKENELKNVEKLFQNIFSQFPELHVQQIQQKDNINQQQEIDNILENIYQNVIINNPQININKKNILQYGVTDYQLRKVGGINNIKKYIKNKQNDTQNINTEIKTEIKDNKKQNINMDIKDIQIN